MKQKKKKEINMGNYVVGSMMVGTVAGTMAQSTGSTMTANLMKGAAKPVVPVMRVKGTTMVLKSVGKLKKSKKKLLKVKSQAPRRLFYKKKDGEGYGYI